MNISTNVPKSTQEEQVNGTIHHHNSIAISIIAKPNYPKNVKNQDEIAKFLENSLYILENMGWEVKVLIGPSSEIAETLKDLPKNVAEDITNGFTISDQDDGYQRYIKINETSFIFKCEKNGLTIEESIDTTDIDEEDAISGFYESIEDVKEQYGEDANLIIAECYFEHYCI